MGDNDFDTARSRETSFERLEEVSAVLVEARRVSLAFSSSVQGRFAMWFTVFEAGAGGGEETESFAVATGKLALALPVVPDVVTCLFWRDCEPAVDCCPCSTFLSILETSSSESCTGFLDTFENMARAPPSSSTAALNCVACRYTNRFM